MWRLVAGWTGDSAAGAVAGVRVRLQRPPADALRPPAGAARRVRPDRAARRRPPGHARPLARRGAAGRRAGPGRPDLDLSARRSWPAPSSSASPRGPPSGAADPVRTWSRSRAGAGLGALCLAPVLAQYWLVNRELGFERTLADAAQYGATWRDYLATGGRLHYALWSAAFFPGSARAVPRPYRAGPRRARRRRGRRAIAAACACWWPSASSASRSPSVRRCRCTAGCSRRVPLLRATRVAARWGVLFLTAVAVLAGFGAAALRARATPRMAAALAWLLPALVTLEAARTPMAFTPTPPIPPSTPGWRRSRDAVLLEFPLFPGSQFNLNAPYLLAQTVHFHPIVAGYSGFATPAYTARTTALGRFPADEARQVIRDDRRDPRGAAPRAAGEGLRPGGRGRHRRRAVADARVRRRRGAGLPGGRAAALVRAVGATLASWRGGALAARLGA